MERSGQHHQSQLSSYIKLKFIKPHISAHLLNSNHRAVGYKGKVMHVLHLVQFYYDLRQGLKLYIIYIYIYIYIYMS